MMKTLLRIATNREQKMVTGCNLSGKCLGGVPHHYGTDISRYALVLLHSKEIRAIQYFRLMVPRARVESDSGRIRAVAANSGPVIFPRMVQGKIRTLELLRIRLNLPESLRLITYSLSPSSPNHTGVRTMSPDFR